MWFCSSRVMGGLSMFDYMQFRKKQLLVTLAYLYLILPHTSIFTGLPGA